MSALPTWPAFQPGLPALMGIVNVTPDSFSDGGRHDSTGAAIAHARRLAAEGARILDIGGESTRPGAAPVTPDAEQARVVPVIAALARARADGDPLLGGVLLSADTRNAATMRAALAAGADIINDIAALAHDPEALGVAVEHQALVVLMHMQGEPQTMQQAPHYEDVVEEVFAWIAARIAAVEAAGLRRDRIAADIGIGFGKTVAHNLALLRALPRFAQLGVPHLLGVSRKGLIARLCAGEPPDERLPGSLAFALHGAAAGVHMLRVHDVAPTLQALKIAAALRSD